MPQGKPAGVRCVQLDADERCRLFGKLLADYRGDSMANLLANVAKFGIE